MRRPIIAGNWKMNKNPAQAQELASAVVSGAEAYKGVDVVLAPTALCLTTVEAVTRPGDVHVAAQNMHVAPSGAYTGELGGSMLRDAGCTYVIIGHSERRQLFGETDEGVNSKLKAALNVDLTPIVCIGETLQERENGKTNDKVAFQVTAALAGLSADDASDVVLAYEPIWAIGTGLTASPEQAQEVHAMIRQLLTSLYGAAIASTIRIQYGGSVKPANIEALIAQPDIDGALVGGASLKAESFLALVEAAQAYTQS